MELTQEAIYIDMQEQETKLKYQIKEQRKKVSNEYKARHKTLFRAMDIAIVLAILFNIGAVILTNALIAKTTPGLVICEANPAQTLLNGFQPVDDSKPIYFGFLVHIAVLAFIVGTYIYQRNTVTNQAELFAIIVTVLILIIGCTLDFSNDLGYWIGKMIWH